MPIEAALIQIEFVKHPVIADSQFEFGAVLESLVWEAFQACTHLIHLALDGVTDRCWEGIKCFGKRGRPNLERGGHSLFWPARRVLPRRDLGPGLVQLGFYVIGQFELVFQIIVDPSSDLFDFRA